VSLAFQKFLGRLIMPSGLLWLVLIATTVFAWRRWSRKQACAWTLVLVAYTLIGNSWLGAAMVGALEAQIPMTHLTDGGKFDAVFVLGGGTKPGPDGRPQLGSVGDRVALAARLYHAGRTPVLVTSGSSIAALGLAMDISEQTATIWRELGVPDTAIRQIAKPKNTSQELAAYPALIEAEGWKRVGVISSAWHLPRVLRGARRHGLELVPLPADHRGIVPGLALVWFVPQAIGFQQVQSALWELVGMAVGR